MRGVPRGFAGLRGPDTIAAFAIRPVQTDIGGYGGVVPPGDNWLAGDALSYGAKDEQRLVAIALADQAGAALANARRAR